MDADLLRLPFACVVFAVQVVQTLQRLPDSVIVRLSLGQVKSVVAWTDILVRVNEIAVSLSKDKPKGVGIERY